MMLLSDRTGGFLLRPYQQEVLDDIRKGIAAGVRRHLLVLATGLGKTVIAAHLPEIGLHKILFVAHRQELIHQARDAFERANPHLSVSIEMADSRADHGVQIVIASIQTVGRTLRCEDCPGPACPRCAGRGVYMPRAPKRDWDAVVIDEAHHTAARTYLNLLRALGAGRPDGPVLIGITATPYRGDKRSLADIYDQVTSERDVVWGIRSRWLCRVRGLRVYTETDLSGVKVRGGEFVESDLAKTVNVQERNLAVIRAIEEHAHDRKSILVFSADVSHGQAIEELLREAKLGEVASVFGATPLRQRVQTVEAFRQRKLRILVGCGVFLEGFDAPATDCLVMARPTRSPLLYAQMLGRGMRPYQGKDDLLVIDLADNCGRHSQHVQSLAKHFGLRDVDLLGHDVLRIKEKTEQVEKDGLSINMDGCKTAEDMMRRRSLVLELLKGARQIATIAEAIDVLQASSVEEEVAKHSAYPWLRVGPERWAMSAPVPEGGSRLITIHRDPLGRWQISDGMTAKAIGGTSLAPAWSEADRFARQVLGSCDIMKRLTANWRKSPASDKQLQLLARLGIKCVPGEISKGDASTLIDWLLIGRKRIKVGQASSLSSGSSLSSTSSLSSAPRA